MRFLRSLVGGTPETEFGLVAARHEIDYVQPMFYSPEPVTVRVWIDRIGTSSFRFGCEIIDPSGVVRVRAKTVIVAVRPDGRGSKAAAGRGQTDAGAIPADDVGREQPWMAPAGTCQCQAGLTLTMASAADVR